MSPSEVVVVPCPPELRTEALALALVELAPSQRREIGREALRIWRDNDASAATLFVALSGDRLCGAIWGQLQPGNTAVFWPPRFDGVANTAPLAKQLSIAVVDALDAAQVAMTQVLLAGQDAPEVPLLTTVGFRYLTDLVYLSCERERLPQELPVSTNLKFVEYESTQRARLAALLEQTYEGTLDCVGLGVERNIEDVIDGYIATGNFRPSNWFFVQEVAASGEESAADIGVLLLAEHPTTQNLELTYVGLVPRAAAAAGAKKLYNTPNGWLVEKMQSVLSRPSTQQICRRSAFIALPILTHGIGAACFYGFYRNEFLKTRAQIVAL